MSFTWLMHPSVYFWGRQTLYSYISSYKFYVNIFLFIILYVPCHLNCCRRNADKYYHTIRSVVTFKKIWSVIRGDILYSLLSWLLKHWEYWAIGHSNMFSLEAFEHLLWRWCFFSEYISTRTYDGHRWLTISRHCKSCLVRYIMRDWHTRDRKGYVSYTCNRQQICDYLNAITPAMLTT